MLKDYANKPIRVKRSSRAWRYFVRLVMLLLGLVPITFGISVILKGQYFYSNYWGGVVFGPFAIVVGLIIIFIALFSNWEKLQKTNFSSKETK